MCTNKINIIEHDVEYIQYFIGILILIIVAVAAYFVGATIPFLHPLLVSICFGFFICNIVSLESFRSGISTHKLWLAGGIVLMGATVSLEALRQAGFTIIFFVLSISLLFILTVEFISRVVFKIDKKFGSLLASGASICGVSAIAAVAASINVKKEQIAFAAATIILFDALTIVIFPIVGEALSLNGQQFGVWAGVSMFSTGPVIAAGFIHSEVAGQWATVTKLARNSLIGFLSIIYVLYYSRYDSTNKIGDLSSIRSYFSTIWSSFPNFIIGFFFLMILVSLGIISDSKIVMIESLYNWFFLIAFAGLGTEIRIKTMRQSGVVPIIIILISLFLVSSISLVGIVHFI